MTRLWRTVQLLALAPVLLIWATLLHTFVIVGVTVQGIRKVWNR